MQLEMFEAPTIEYGEKKNLFTVTPIQAVDTKAKVKASLASKYIGFGEGITGSSTEAYRKEVGEKYANTGNYNDSDVVFVSVVGKRGGVEKYQPNIDKTIQEVKKALDAGATLLTDNKEYTNKSTYNVGEQQLKSYLESRGISYKEITVDGQTIGIWNSPLEEQTETKPVEPQPISDEEVQELLKNCFK